MPIVCLRPLRFVGVCAVVDKMILMQMLHCVVGVQAVTLRRMKNDTFEGKPLIVLPPKTVTVEHLQFSAQEDAIYAAFEEQSRLDFNEYLRVGFGANYSHILVQLNLLLWPVACCAGQQTPDRSVALFRCILAQVGFLARFESQFPRGSLFLGI